MMRLTHGQYMELEVLQEHFSQEYSLRKDSHHWGDNGLAFGNPAQLYENAVGAFASSRMGNGHNSTDNKNHGLSLARWNQSHSKRRRSWT